MLSFSLSPPPPFVSYCPMLLTVNSWQKCGRNSCQQQLETGRNTFQGSCSLEVDSWSLKAAAASGVRVWEQQNTAGWEVLAEISLGKDCVKGCRQREHPLFPTDTKSYEKSCRWASIWIRDLSVFFQTRMCGGETSTKAGPLPWGVRCRAGHSYLPFSSAREAQTVPCTDQELPVFFTMW